MEDRMRELAGNRYRVERGEDRFYQVVLKAGRGWIYQHGPETLAAHLIDLGRPVATVKALMRKCPKAWVHVMGDSEAIVLHPLEGWRKFFSACGAMRRRTVSESERKRLVEVGRHSRFVHGFRIAPEARESANGTEGE